MNNKISFSMNGFRRNLHSDLKELKEIVESVINDEWFDKEDLERAMNEVICQSNCLNCVWLDGDENFKNMEDLELPMVNEN
ncbi:hypothetical protein [Vibrio cholerae]|uniref:hypothetical protein n=1 Tax=Vibrio cholerae TaxID=666 RepID=UPI00301891E6